MLSWSSTQTGGAADLSAFANAGGDTLVDHGFALLRFASACAGTDDAELDAARSALVAATEIGFMVDAAAVAANFEMMTRLADSTGARMQAEIVDDRAETIAVMGVGTLASRR